MKKRRRLGSKDFKGRRKKRKNRNGGEEKEKNHFEVPSLALGYGIKKEEEGLVLKMRIKGNKNEETE